MTREEVILLKGRVTSRESAFWCRPLAGEYELKGVSLPAMST